MASVLELFNNRGLFSTSGVDLQVRYGGDAPGWLGGDRGHQLNVDLVWTHTMSLDSQENPVSSVLDCLGFFGSECAGLGGTAPENRVSANFGYSTANLNVLLSTVWVDGTDNWGKVDYKYFGGPPAMLAIPSIGSQFYADLSIAYQFSDNLSASFGIANLLDRDPPMMAGVPTGNNTDTGLYDIFGRAYRVTFSYRVGN